MVLHIDVRASFSDEEQAAILHDTFSRISKKTGQKIFAHVALWRELIPADQCRRIDKVMRVGKRNGWWVINRTGRRNANTITLCSR